MSGSDSSDAEHGRLLIVATPIGNLGDLSRRAIDTLRDVDLIVAEDTRRTRNLLAHAQIKTNMVSYHRDNEKTRLEDILKRLESGEILALVSDAGVPLISDPGALLVRACIDRAIPVECVPGPSAVTTAIVLSGLPAGRFIFEGFLPRNAKSRRSRLAEMASEERTMVFFEAPHRVKTVLADLAAAFGGERRCALCRELTKVHEEIWRCSLDEVVERISALEPRGEYVLVVEGADISGRRDREAGAAARESISLALEAGLTPRKAADAGQAAGLSRSSAYKLAVAMSRQGCRKARE